MTYNRYKLRPPRSLPNYNFLAIGYLQLRSLQKIPVEISLMDHTSVEQHSGFLMETFISELYYAPSGTLIPKSFVSATIPLLLTVHDWVE